MKNLSRLFMVLLLTMSFVSCVEETEDENVKLDPKSSINIELKVTHGATFDLLTTTKTIHDEKGKVVNVITSTDTIPRLSMVKDTLETNRTREDEYGDEVAVDTIITHPKDYQLYISVKK